MTTTMEPKTSTGIRFIVNRPEFAAALQSLANVANPKFKPILGCVRIEASGNVLKLRATNLEISLDIEIAQVQIESEGVTLANCGKLSQITKEMDEDTLGIQLVGSDLVIRGNAGDFRVPTADPKDFPPSPVMEEATLINLPGSTLRSLLRHTAFSAGEKTVYGVNGVGLSSAGGRLIAEASDGHRCVSDSEAVNTKVKASAVVPTETAKLLTRLIDDEADAEIAISANHLRVISGSMTLFSLLLEKKMPPIDDEIKKGGGETVRLGREELLKCIRQVSLVSRDDLIGTVIGFKFSDEGLHLSGRTVENGAAKIHIPCKFGASTLKIGIESKYLTEPLRESAADEVELVVGEGRPLAVIKLGGEYRYGVALKGYLE